MKKFLTAAVALTVLASAGAAAAQPHPKGQQGQGQHGPARVEHRDDRYERAAPKRYKAARYKAPRGYQARSWHRGDRLPSQYRGNSYRVDYRAYRLAPPPRGYEYHRVGNDVVLTAIASGVIASVLIGMFN